MGNHLYGRVAYDAYLTASGMQRDIKDTPPQEFDKLTEPEKAGWEAAGKSCGLPGNIGDTATDVLGVSGIIRSKAIDRSDVNGYWVACLNSTGQPFDHFIQTTDLAKVQGPDGVTTWKS